MHKFALMMFVNISSVLLLVALIVGPLLIAKNMAKVAGVKSESKYLIVSQIERFPNLSLVQKENTYSISFAKQGPSQAYIGVLIVNNPTETTQTYSIGRISGDAQPFFGENPDDQSTKVTVPSQASVPLSLFSDARSESENQTVEFRIQAE
ncbi:hypothetical protein A2W45_02825 [Candidatus Curtissbacteria bacterium RIFCSPHIGHO2_12_41_11]|uniref:Uncharacterized protein n=2 Tax=Candidatus Curtissiibacteriota TaxID=1752717 RepID=A0A1F5H1Y5_9BACT|nr:MAG: hypothetical protein A2W45_02825 [Candidatus Curtissbacteria bacterium RIFCSPHIGHO2_12_41_11]